jgi:hypothetical protein
MPIHHHSKSPIQSYTTPAVEKATTELNPHEKCYTHKDGQNYMHNKAGRSFKIITSKIPTSTPNGEMLFIMHIAYSNV